MQPKNQNNKTKQKSETNPGSVTSYDNEPYSSQRPHEAKLEVDVVMWSENASAWARTYASMHAQTDRQVEIIMPPATNSMIQYDELY